MSELSEPEAPHKEGSLPLLACAGDAEASALAGCCSALRAAARVDVAFRTRRHEAIGRANKKGKKKKNAKESKKGKGYVRYLV